ncbi:hypothetical protein ACOJBM_41935 [Rhizobium beringeri]
MFEKAATRILNRERMLRAATARSTETVVRQHGLKPLKHFLPANPRRIKRIINMVSAYQASAQSTQGVKQGSDKWKQLVIWVVMMSEYPQIWKMLVTDPDRSAQLLDLIKASKKGEAIVPPGLPGRRVRHRQSPAYRAYRAIGHTRIDTTVTRRSVYGGRRHTLTGVHRH